MILRAACRRAIRLPLKQQRGRYRVPLYACALSALAQVDFTGDSLHQSKDIYSPNILELAPTYIATQSVQASRSVLDDLKLFSFNLVKKVSRSLRYTNRVLTYIMYGIPMAILAPTTMLLGKYIPGLEDFVWDYCLWSVCQLGPTFIKLAQWASTRPDLFPPKLVERLQSLQDNVQVPYTFSTVERTLTEAFGEKWRKEIELDPTPIGTGCVAQVYRGRMLGQSNRSEVAIKMIHPHVETLVAIDMDLLSKLAFWLDTFPDLEMLNLGETLTQFGDMMRRQLDLRNEAYNLLTFGKKFKDDPWALFPAPIEGYVRKNVLVETLMEGSSIVNYMSNTPSSSLKIPDHARIKGPKDFENLKLKLSDLGARLILKMVFFDNFVHGDLHPGNLMVNFDSRGEPHLVVLDCGIVYQARSESEHKRLVDICFAFMQHDGRKAGMLMIDKGLKGSQEHAEAFCNGVHQMIIDSEGQSYFEHLGEYIGRLCELARTCAVKLDPGYFAIAMALKVVEGVSLALNQDLDMVSKCVPIVIKTRTMRALGIEKFPLPEEGEIEEALKKQSLIVKKKT